MLQKRCLSVAALLAMAGVVPSMAQQAIGPDGIASHTINGGEIREALRAGTVALPGGQVIHTTTNSILGLRHIPLPGGGTLMVWDEFTASGRVPHYAFSLDGQTLAGRVREHSHLIPLRFQAFDPLAGEPGMAPQFRAADSSRLRLVQFHAAPLPEMQAAIEAMGAEILRFLPDSTFIVRMDEAAAARVGDLPFVRSVGRFHTAYKLDAAVIMDILAAADDPIETRYSIEVFDRGMKQQQAVADAVRAAGGIVEVFTPDQFRLEVTTTPQILLQIAMMDEVHFVDHWGGPGGTDMNIVRQLGGANFLESAGVGPFQGQGVRGEIFDTEVLTSHTEWIAGTTVPLLHSVASTGTGGLHGTGPYSINFARGANANARGLLPQAERGIFFMYQESTQFGGAKSRLLINQELVAPGGNFRGVFQTSSVGSAHTTSYTTLTQEIDDAIFQTNLLMTQSMGNLGTNDIRPQALAKNIVGVGGIVHLNSADRSLHRHVTPTGGSCGVPSGSAASIGPAGDGRIKPDLAYFYDCITSAWGTGNTNYTEFSGTSGATPTVAGHFGLFFQMWHQGVWKGRGGASSVLLSRPSQATARAAIISTAFRYTWTAGGNNASLTRPVQGWGTPSLQPLYELRGRTFIVDGEDVLTPLSRRSYQVKVASGEPTLNVVMCYTDPPGTTSASIHRINDLTLRVTSPTGTVFWGNNGLSAGNFNTAGGASNTRDTTECVFVQNPAAGVWTIEVLGDVITTSNRPGFTGASANYSLWVTGVADGKATIEGPVVANPSKAYAPLSRATTNGTTGLSSLLRDLPRAYQTVIAASELDYLPVGSMITGMSVRQWSGAAGNWPATDATWADYQVEIASTTASPTAMSSTFASNVGADAVQVRSGPLTIPAGSIRNDGELPRAQGPTIAFTRPFQYKGGNLVVTVRHSGNTIASLTYADSVVTGAQIGAMYSTDSMTAATASFTNTEASVLRFMTSPGDISPDSAATTAGGTVLNSLVQTGGRTVQMIIGQQYLSHIPLHSTIDALAFRAAPGQATWPGVSHAFFGDYQVEIGRSANLPSAMSTTVANNHSADVIVARTGPFTVAQGSALGGPGMNPFGLVIPLDRKYVYRGGPLVVTFRHTGSSITPVFFETGPVDPNMAQGFATGATATTIGLGNPHATLVMHTPSVTVPNDYAMAPPPTTGGNSGVIFNTGGTVQILIARSQLTHIPTGSLINGMTWRNSNSVAQSTWPVSDAFFNQYDVQLSRPATTAGTMSTTFDTNLGSAVVLVRSGPLTIPAGSFPHAGPSPALSEFGNYITFDRPYEYAGGDLLITIRHSGAGSSGHVFFDGLFNGGPGYGVVGASVVSTAGPTATSGSLTRMVTTRLAYTPKVEATCYANCDGSTTPPVLNIDDFTCFINQFAAGQALPPAQQVTHYSNCDGSTTAPVLNIDDFTCFINRFALGCP